LDKDINPQKDVKITRQEQKQHMVDKDSPWILERAITTSRMGNQSVSIATSMSIWLKNVGTRRKRRKLRSVSSVTKNDTLQRTIKRNSQ